MSIKTVLKNSLPRKLVYAYYKKRRTPRTSLNFDVHLTEHCNLNCSGCNHFSPLAQEEFTDLAVYQKDLQRIVELFGSDKISNINLLGGEPLLHPQLLEFMRVSRAALPETDINILTNGVLLLKQPAAFWEACRRYKIILLITKYPVKFDYDKVEKVAEKENVQLLFFGKTDKEEKKFYRVPLDLKGKQDKDMSFVMCNRANACIQLQNGKLFTCPTVAYIRHFNEHFQENLQLEQGDYVDIYKAKDAQEVVDKLSNPIPFCRYCMIKDKVESLKWTVSSKELQEWT